MKNHHYALIMAGGQGTRFWPWSTAAKPKQFLSVVGEEALIRQTYNRLQRFIPIENIFIVADRKYLPAVLECLPGFPQENYIVEPAPRNTAPCLILANIFLSRRDPDAHLLVVPADHHIPDTEVFAAQLRDALDFAGERVIVTAGVKPDSPHTGYGYIEFVADEAVRGGDTPFHPVRQFREKPDRQTAEGFIQAGNFYWNSGMFVYRLRHFREFFQQYSPYYFEQYQALEAAFTDPAAMERVFCAIRPDSIDYALMEKVREVRMFQAAFRWNDVGSWSSVFEMNPADENGNVRRGNTVAIDTRDSLVFAVDDRPLGIIGLQDVAVISTANGVLVCPRTELQRVKEILAQLK